MKERNYFQQVQKNYEEINNRWLNLHFHLLLSCAVIGIFLECIMFFVVKAVGQLNCTPEQYAVKYIIVPSAFMIAITIVSFLIVRTPKLSTSVKQYSISILFALFAFVISMVHSIFIAALASAIFPILMTVMYECQRLTFITGGICTISQALNGFFIFWDSDKKMTDLYAIDVAITIVVTILVWYSCFLMIKFCKKKRAIILTNDVERVRLQDEIVIDPLTGVGNKLALKNKTEQPLIDNQTAFFIAMLDIDGFKRINDTYGHLFGDEVLKCIGTAMLNIHVPASAYRYGGDEFCIIFDEPSLELVIEQVKMIQQHLKDEIKMPNDDGDVLLSVGITERATQKSWSALLEQADNALYESKRNANGRIVLFSKMHAPNA